MYYHFMIAHKIIRSELGIEIFYWIIIYLYGYSYSLYSYKKTRNSCYLERFQIYL